MRALVAIRLGVLGAVVAAVDVIGCGASSGGAGSVSGASGASGTAAGGKGPGAAQGGASGTSVTDGGPAGGASGDMGGAGDTLTDAGTDADSSIGNGGASGEGGEAGQGGTDAGSCDISARCGTACCAVGSVCSFESCVVPGVACSASTNCGATQYCEYTLGTDEAADPGDASCVAAARTGKCLPLPPTCSADASALGTGTSCLAACNYDPVAAPQPTLKAAWGGQIFAPFSTDVMMAPIVIPLADTNCDGKVTAQDTPDILFTSFSGGAYTTNGTLHAVRYIGGSLVDQWSATGINPSAQLAAGNIDGAPGNEVIACGNGNSTNAFHADGTPLWSAPYACSMPSIADLDGDGQVEVIVEGGILNGATGALKHAFTPALVGHFVASDIDGDGQLDVVLPDRAYHADGTLFVDTKLGGSWSAVADFDHTGLPEVVLVDTAHHAVMLWRYDSAAPAGFDLVRSAVDMNGTFATNHCPTTFYGYAHGGGPPVIADFNGDGTPDIGLAGGIGYVTFDGKKLLDATQTGIQATLWTAPTTDCSSAQTSSVAFDFLGNGKADVVYSDEQRLRIFDGSNGAILFETCNTTATLTEEPVVADIDGDGHADVVVASNAYASGNTEYQCSDGTNLAQSGVRVFGDAVGSWVRSPPIWNEHAYHVTNITADGLVPQHEPANAAQAGLDNFRQTKLPGADRAAPDAVVSVAPVCPGLTGLAATVRNVGAAPLPAGITVGFYEGSASGTRLGQATTTHVLGIAEAEHVTLTLSSPKPASVVAIVDDGAPSHPSWHECDVTNDTSAVVAVQCP